MAKSSKPINVVQLLGLVVTILNAVVKFIKEHKNAVGIDDSATITFLVSDETSKVE